MSLDSILRSTGKNLFDKTIPYSSYDKDSDVQAGGYGALRFYVGVGTPVTISFTAPTEAFTGLWMFITFSHLAKMEQSAITKYQILLEGTKVRTTLATNTSTDGYVSFVLTERTYNFIINNNIQIELGSTATSYEPYHQGPKSITIPSDSKNLIKYPYDTNTTTINGVTFTVNSDGGITVNGTATTTAVFYIKSDFITLTPNKQYTLSGFTSGTGCSLNLHSKDDLQNIGLVEQQQTKTFTAGYEKYYCYLAIGATKTANATFYPQLEEGITATDYSLNAGDKEVLKVSYGSKNLFDISSSVGFQSMYQGVTSTISDTTITTSSTANRSCNLLLGNFSAGTYTISFSNTDFSLLMLQYGETLEKLSRLDNVNFVSSKSHTFTLAQPVKLWLESTIATNKTRTITDIQLELGNKATEYVPYSREVVWTK